MYDRLVLSYIQTAKKFNKQMLKPKSIVMSRAP